jgi:DNA-binding response OmpR family regulator
MQADSDDQSARLRVLIVEDDAPVCDVIGQFLHGEGFETICALSDRDAYALLDAEWRSIDGLVVDVDLGRGTTGFDVGRYARRLNPRLPVVYVTGAGGAADRHAVSGSAVLTKPLEPEHLVATLREKLAEPVGSERPL